MIRTNERTRLIFWSFEGSMDEKSQSEWAKAIETIKSKNQHKTAIVTTDAVIQIGATKTPTMAIMGHIDDAIQSGTIIIIIPDEDHGIPEMGRILDIASNARDYIFTAREVTQRKLARPELKPAPQPKEPGKITVGERLSRGRIEGAKNGWHQSGPAPFGYKRQRGLREGRAAAPMLIPDPVEAPIVQMIFREYLRRRSLIKVKYALDDMGIKTRRGKPWSRAGLSWIVRNETYIGIVGFGDIRSTGKHEALISPIVFNKANKLMNKNNKRGGKSKLKVKS